MKPSANKMSLDDQIEIAANQLVRARISFDIWWYYAGDATRAVALESMNEFPEFFRFDEHAHRTSFIIQIATLFDKRKDSVTLEKLRKTVLKKFGLGNGFKSELNLLFTDINKIASKILILRHNAFAHRSESLDFNDSFKAANVSFTEMLLLTQKSKQVLDQFLLLTGKGKLEFRDFPKNDLEDMLRRLKPISENTH